MPVLGLEGGGGGRSGEMCCYLPCCVSRKSVIRRV